MDSAAPGTGEAARNTAEAVARRSYGKLVAFLSAGTRDVAGAEDALSDAFSAALTDWPAKGVPNNPEAWLLTTARRRLADRSRRERTRDRAGSELRRMAEELEEMAANMADIPDRRLALMFACAHPAIDATIRAPLILQTVLGFDAATIASAFLVAPSTMGQRLVRAKDKIRQAGIPFRVPDKADLSDRLDAVLEAIYAAYAEGWSNAAGTEVSLRSLAEEGIWLARLAVSLLPGEPEALGLLALILYAEARREARRNAAGDYVPLTEQNTELWDAAMIEEAEALLRRASGMGAIGRYQLEAALQSAHVVRRQTGMTDRAAVVQLYDALLALTGSPVVAVNRAIAVAEAEGPDAGLDALGLVADDRRVAQYQPYWAARASLLARTGERRAADAAYARAIGLEADPAVRRFLAERREELYPQSGPA